LFLRHHQVDVEGFDLFLVSSFFFMIKKQDYPVNDLEDCGCLCILCSVLQKQDGRLLHFTSCRTTGKND